MFHRTTSDDEPMTPQEIAAVTAEIVEAMRESGEKAQGKRLKAKVGVEKRPAVSRHQAGRPTLQRATPADAVMPAWGTWEQVGAWFAMTRTEIYALVKSHEIVSEKSGKRRRIYMASVDEYLMGKSGKRKAESCPA